MQDSHSQPDAFIRLYRIVSLICISKQLPLKDQQKLYTFAKINDDAQYKNMVDTMLLNYPNIKDKIYKGYTISQWCMGINSKIDYSEPLTNRWADFPLATRAAVNSILSPAKKTVKYKPLNGLQEALGPSPFEDFEKLIAQTNIDTVRNRIIIDRAYLLLLYNSYLYYHGGYENDYVDNKYITNDYQWDWLSRQLGHIKTKLDSKRYPILFDYRFEGGQSLFWLSKEQYPQQAIV